MPLTTLDHVDTGHHGMPVHEVVLLAETDAVGLAARRLAESGVRRLFVLGDDELVGVVTRGDLLRLLARTEEPR